MNLSKLPRKLAEMMVVMFVGAILIMGCSSCSTIEKVDDTLNRGLDKVDHELAEIKPKVDRVFRTPNEVRKKKDIIKKRVERLAHTAFPPTYRVKAGDTFWYLADAHYGDPFYWPHLYKANRDYVLDPDLIYEHQILDMPLPPNAAQAWSAVDYAEKYPDRPGPKPRRDFPPVTW